MDKEQQLREEHEGIAQRLRAKEDEYQAAEEGLRTLVSELLASANGQRETLISRRAMMATNRDVLRDEIVELQRRRMVAWLAIHEYRELVARAEVARLEAAARAARLLVNEKIEQLRRHMNTRGEIRERATIEGDAARARAESLIVARDLERARVRHQREEAEVQRARQSFGIALDGSDTAERLSA